MGEFIVSVVVDVLIHVFIQHRDGGGVEWITGSTRDFAVLDACEFVVLNPKVGLDYFRRCCEPALLWTTVQRPVPRSVIPARRAVIRTSRRACVSRHRDGGARVPGRAPSPARDQAQPLSGLI